METSEHTPLVNREPLTLNNEAIQSLRETRKWTTFFGILGILMVVILVITSLIMVFVLPFMNENAGTTINPILFSAVYLFLGGIFVLPIIYLMRFGSLIRKAFQESSDQFVGQALKNLALHFRTVGIITIVMIGLYILFIIAMVIFGAGMFTDAFLKG
jgi:amino acid transporter